MQIVREIVAPPSAASHGKREGQTIVEAADDAHILRLGLELPVCRVIVNQVHCVATGGSFDNALPFSLSMGCGTWGRNNFSDNLHFRHYLNITRIVRKIPERIPSEQEIFGDFLKKYGE